LRIGQGSSPSTTAVRFVQAILVKAINGSPKPSQSKDDLNAVSGVEDIKGEEELPIITYICDSNGLPLLVVGISNAVL
jgi:hypothetical protein